MREVNTSTLIISLEPAKVCTKIYSVKRESAGGKSLKKELSFKTSLGRIHMSSKQNTEVAVVVEPLSHVRLFCDYNSHSSVHGILQARILEWGAIPFARASS